MRSAKRSILAVAALALLAGCGSGADPNTSLGPGASVWVLAPPATYAQITAGAKLAVAERGGRAGAFRVGFVAQSIGGQGQAARAAAADAARRALEDRSTAVVIAAGPAPIARETITLLNEVGVPVLVLGDDALRTEVCADRSALYPSGLRSGRVVEDAAAPAAFARRFRARTGSPATGAAYEGYRAAVLAIDGVTKASADRDVSAQTVDLGALKAAVIPGRCS